MMLSVDFDVVSRRLPIDRNALPYVLAQFAPSPRGRVLRVDGGFVASGGGALDGWEATGTLRASRARRTRVALTVAPWSNDVSELRLRPCTRRFATWGRHRQRRYFRLAHRAADDLASALVTAADVATPRGGSRQACS